MNTNEISPRQMIDALETLWDIDPTAAARFEAIGLSNISAHNARALVAAANRNA